MKYIIVTAICITGITCFYNCVNQEKYVPIIPKISLAHGALIGSDGVIEADAAYIANIQNNLIQTYNDSLNLKAKREKRNISKNVYAKVQDKILANALYIDWIVDNINIEKRSNLEVANNALRWYYVTKIQKDPIFPVGNDRWSKGIKLKPALELEALGMKVFREVQKGSPIYIENCLEAGVPVPDTLFTNQWHRLGTLQDNMLSEDERELRMYISKDPPGFCISLVIELGISDHLDIICFGTQTDNACFFGHINDRFPFKKRSILDIPGGEETGQTCISCHAGENPFIVHPADPAFIKAYKLKGDSLMNGYNLNGTGNKMFTAVGIPEWPPNPPPLENLNISGLGETCTKCHHSSYAGRFPDLSQLTAEDREKLRNYCNIILPATIGEQEGFNATMPYTDIENIHKYIDQIGQIKETCNLDPLSFDEGKIVDNVHKDNPSFRSPPKIKERIIDCAEVIYVVNFLEGATLTLFINNIKVESIVITNEYPDVEFSNFQKLSIGDKIHVEQHKVGVEPSKSTPVFVLDDKIVYPHGIPPPSIDPSTIYECSTTIGAHYDNPGLPLEVFVNGEFSFKTYTNSGLTAVYPNNSPWNIGDEFTAKVIVCDEESVLSNKVLALKKPENLELAEINPESLYKGQKIITISNLTPGSKSTLVNENSDVIKGLPHWPFSWKNVKLSQPIVLTDQVFVSQELCDLTSTGFSRPFKVKSCDDNDVPIANIRDPRPGDNYILVIGQIPGSRTLIIDSEGVEIGDSEIGIVELSRVLVQGETITAFLIIGDCTSQLAIQYVV